FGRRVDLGLETHSKIKFDNTVRTMDLDKGVLWLQVGMDIVSFDIQEAISSVDPSSGAKIAWLHRSGRNLEIHPGNPGEEIRIHRLDGVLEARFQAGSGPVRWVAPGPGMRIVRVGASARTVLVP
ncbi:MAG TPA: hypothetical protein PKY05_17785, partial [Fibrobacteria bacterium]|nr:hypothetical protein [Fibrobacteria bacterium]